uniref:Uncharacterized protein n=1 Tax=Anopheles atroparvus TaxID=41427 RepID=A0A182J1M5_ANOAO
MAHVCFACANDLSPDTDASRCVICEAWFHDACTKIPCSILTGIKQYANLHWSCPGCTKALSNPRSKALKDIGLQAGFQSALGALVEALKEAIVQPLTSEMHSLVKSSTAHSSCTGSNVAASHVDRTSPVAQSHRQFTYADTLRRTPAPEHVVITGTNAASPNLIATQDRSPQRFWLHIMGLANTITVEQVTASVSRRLATEDVLAFSLLGRGVDPSSRRALSFKPESNTCTHWLTLTFSTPHYRYCRHAEAIPSAALRPSRQKSKVGDFNLPSIVWSTDHATPPFFRPASFTQRDVPFIDGLHLNGLTQLSGIFRLPVAVQVHVDAGAALVALELARLTLKIASLQSSQSVIIVGTATATGFHQELFVRAEDVVFRVDRMVVTDVLARAVPLKWPETFVVTTLDAAYPVHGVVV